MNVKKTKRALSHQKHREPEEVIEIFTNQGVLIPLCPNPSRDRSNSLR